MTITAQRKNGVAYLACDGIDTPHAFSTRLGGVSEGIWTSMNLGTTRGDKPGHVRENYRRFCAAVGVDDRRIVMSNQVHGAEIRAVTAADVKCDLYDPEGYEVDGLMTDERGLTLVIFSADCIPVLLCDKTRGAIAAIHAGWRGTAACIAGKAVAAMATAYGCRPEDIRAAIGPGISTCCFETDADVPDAMTAAFGEAAAPYLRPLSGGRYKVDLKGLNALSLTRVGIPAPQIAIAEDCTACLTERYWSHRVTSGVRGSQAAVIALQ